MSVKTVCRYRGEPRALPTTRPHRCRPTRGYRTGDPRPGPGFVMRWRLSPRIFSGWGGTTTVYLETTSPHIEARRALGGRSPAAIACECVEHDRRCDLSAKGLARRSRTGRQQIASVACVYRRLLACIAHERAKA